jgi:hypothetical protein
MNIFVLSLCPLICAKQHNDKHCVKMILETAQMLCTAHHLCSDDPNPKLYKKAFENHPCSKWVRLTIGNYIWLYELFRCLCKEYTYRYLKVHMCEKKLIDLLNEIPEKIPKGNITIFPQAMPDYCKHKNPIIAYRQYYINEKSSFCTWSKRDIPYWYK